MEILDIKRGDILLINTHYDIDTNSWISRPFLAIQNDIGNKYSPTVIVIAITSRFDRVKLPTHVELPREVSGLEKDSVVLAEQVTTYDKKRLQDKIGGIGHNSKYMTMIEKAMLVSIGRLVPKNEVFSFGGLIPKNEVFSFENIANDYTSYIEELTKPVIITEGKTDIRYLKIAWEKLYPNREMYFNCIPSGWQVDEETRTGSSSAVRQALENLSTIDNRTIIGLFDNDRSGNIGFGGLNKHIFKKDSLKYNLKKHIERNIWGMLLPVPVERQLFVTLDDTDQRYFAIEHYFSDEVLKEYNMYGRKILCTSVFEISGDKNNFSKKINDLDVKEFENFRILFEEIEKVFNTVQKE